MHDTLPKHSLAPRTSKSIRAPSNDYVRMKNPPEPPEPNAAKKKPKEKSVDKVNTVNSKKSFQKIKIILNSN